MNIDYRKIAKILSEALLVELSEARKVHLIGHERNKDAAKAKGHMPALAGEPGTGQEGRPRKTRSGTPVVGAHSTTRGGHRTGESRGVKKGEQRERGLQQLDFKRGSENVLSQQLARKRAASAAKKTKTKSSAPSKAAKPVKKISGGGGGKRAPSWRSM